MHSSSGLLVSCDSKLLCKCSRTQQAPIARMQASQAATVQRGQPLASLTLAAARAGGQQLVLPAQQQHPQQLHPFFQPSSSCKQQLVSSYRRHRTSCLAAAAQEQPVTGTAAEEEQAAPVSSNAEHNQHSSSSSSSSSSNGTNAQQQQQEAPSSSSSATSSEDVADSVGISIKVLEPGQLNAVARLRAEAYYEHDRSRFAASFKKQFASQEAESLRQRTAPTTSAHRPQLCDCLVAVDAGGAVLGCIDIRLPQSYTKSPTIGVPDGDTAGCYLLNVVVSEQHRGQGVGKQVMRAAMRRAVQHWGAQRLYTHVEADNEVANRLYRSCGFQEHSSEEKYANVSSLGRLVLLMATADDVQQQ